MSETLSKTEILVNSWDVVFDKEDWYPPLFDALNGVSSKEAAWRPEGEASNTIWETVNHLLFYKERLLSRIKGIDFVPNIKSNDDTFTVHSQSEDEWKNTVAKLTQIHKEIRDILAEYNDQDLDRPLPKIPIGGQILSLVLHDAYHTGQIILIRKLQGSWPAQSSDE